jgi:hypothetical protein
MYTELAKINDFNDIILISEDKNYELTLSQLNTLRKICRNMLTDFCIYDGEELILYVENEFCNQEKTVVYFYNKTLKSKEKGFLDKLLDFALHIINKYEEFRNFINSQFVRKHIENINFIYNESIEIESKYHYYANKIIDIKELDKYTYYYLSNIIYFINGAFSDYSSLNEILKLFDYEGIVVDTNLLLYNKRLRTYMYNVLDIENTSTVVSQLTYHLLNIEEVENYVHLSLL